MDNKGCLLAGVIVLLFFFVISFLCFLGFAAIGASSEFNSSAISPSETIIQEGDNENKIAVVKVHGMILETSQTSSRWGDVLAASDVIIDQLDAAEKDPNVKAVVLDMNTPGGSVYASERIHNKIEELRSNDKKVIALFRETSASGGYYISTATDKIVADPLTITGSIGVIMEFQDIDGLYDKLGIKTRYMTNTGGKFKTGKGLFDENPNGEEDQIYQKIIDDTYDRFVEVVSVGRNIPESEVRTFADGRIFTGEQAMELGLIDEFGKFDDAINIASLEANVTNPTVVEYESNDFWSTLFGVVSKVNPMVMVGEMANINPGANLMYVMH